MEYKSPFLGLWVMFFAVVWLFFELRLFSTYELPISRTLKTNYKTKLIKASIVALGLLSWLLIAYALTQPRSIAKVIPGNIEVNDIMFVIDTSQSMTIRDLPPNRLEVAKEKIKEFISLRPRDRIGLIVFSERVLTLLPLTVDNKLVQTTVESDVRIIPTLGSGTNIGDSLGLAVARLKNTETKNKIIILLTDGVSNVDTVNPIDVAKLASESNIKVYTIGIGVDRDAMLPAKNGFFQRVTPGGAIDFKMLEEISSLTKAKSYKATSKESLKSIFTDIESLEKTKIKSSNTAIYKEEYYSYLLFGLLLLFLIEGTKSFLLKELI